MIELEKAYEAKNFEDQIYEKWEKSGAFTPKIVKGQKPFVISMPPPNATGTLHLGHATMLAIEDIMVRYQRMQGRPTLWVPGTDHAGIATQNKVEKLLAEEGLTRYDLGREKFIDRVNEFVKNSQNTIRNQVRKMGSSCDWTRERYTLDEGLSKAVREVFVRMYNDGLIYRGNRIINWCVRCSSTLADDEVEFKEEKSKFYYIKYGPVVIGTARPETKFLDKIIVVHPSDARYKKFVGSEVEVEWMNGPIKAKFIADESADPEFGSGAMTITPAHDFTDFDIAVKHKLEIKQIIGPDGNFTDVVGPEFSGKNARKSREAIIELLQNKGLIDRVDENYVHNLSVCYRCGTPVEPLVSDQWFVNVNKPAIRKFGRKVSLKKMAIDVVKKGKIQIIPDRFNKIYFHWLNNLRDWCISRQLWFGHQIPVWYCQSSSTEKCKEPIVRNDAPNSCPHCNGQVVQESDTLDTWYSSGLWTFSTLGWPEQTADLKYFHPTSVLETGYDILFFWVARMILMSTYALKQIPFETVYLHGLVRDKHGKKMSKSAGNGIDPLEMIDKFGTDAVRLSLVIGSSPGNDMRLYEEKIAGYRNFVNKIWNSARFVLMNINDQTPVHSLEASDIKTIADKWILHELQNLIKEVTTDLENHSLSDAGTKIYDFTWGKLCDWYLEWSKSNVNQKVLKYVFTNVLKLLHPFVPFVTEVIWNNMGMNSLLISETWPEFNKKYQFNQDAGHFQIIQDLITAIRSIRAEKNVDVGRKINAILHSGHWTHLIKENVETIKRMARLAEVTIENNATKPAGAIWKYVSGINVYLPAADLFDIQEEKNRLLKKIDGTESKFKELSGRLNNPGFLKKAPAALVEKEKTILLDLENELNSLKEKISELENL